jgi:uncharacterized protein YjbI with pentapeptide repeats
MPADYSGQNLRGRSFKGQNLEGADFSGADIRGADFTGANLNNAIFSKADIRGVKFAKASLIAADFTEARAGLKKSWSALMIVGSLILFGFSGFSYSLAGNLVALILNFNSLEETPFSWIKFLIVLPLFFIRIRNITIITLGINLLIILFVLGICAFLVGILFQEFFGAVIGIIIASISFFFGLEIILLVLHVPILGFSIRWHTLKNNKNNALEEKMHSFAVACASIGGTSFNSSNLTNANFTKAQLKCIDFRDAHLTQTIFLKSSMIYNVRPGKTYLRDRIICDVLVNGYGQKKNFDHYNLRGVNFQGANLVDASFIAANLSQANLQNADLSDAKLVQTLLDGTNLTGATITGACIEDWGITVRTKFDGIKCKYIYMRFPTKEILDPLRKPDNREQEFAEGEFCDFIRPIVDTLDLYHSQNIDPRAIAISFKQLAENHPEAELQVVGIEVKDEDKLLLRAKAISFADKSKLSAEYFDTYNYVKALPEREVKLLLAEKDSRIRSLETMVITALERPNFYSNTQVGQVSTMTSNPGGFSVGGSIGGDVKNLQGDNNRTVQGDNNQGVLGDNNQVRQQNQVGADTGESLTKEDIVKLLAQLETLVKTAEIPAETKEEVVEDLDSAKKATDKEEPNKNRALERLGSMADTLEKTSKTVESGQKIWTTAKPIIVKIATWLGAAAGSHLLGL